MRALAAAVALLPVSALADAPVITDAWIDAASVVHVTVTHPDTGWEHYADGWEVLTQDGTSLGIRVLLHPHETEQPFTRSLRIEPPRDPGDLFVRARCLVDGWSDVLVPVRTD